MKKHFASLASMTAMMTFATQTIAHPGHDHSHWSSPMMHSIFGISMILVAGFAVWKIKARAKHSQKENN